MQEETNGMEPSRSAVLASRENGDYQRDWTGIPGIIQHRPIWPPDPPPDPQVFAGLDLIAKISPESDSVYDLTAIDS